MRNLKLCPVEIFYKIHVFERHCLGNINVRYIGYDLLCILMKIWNRLCKFKQRGIATKRTRTNKLILVIPYRIFGTTCWCNLQESNLVLTTEDGIDWLSRNVGKEIPQYTVSCPRRAQISSSARRKPEMKFLGKNYLGGGGGAFGRKRKEMLT